MAGPRNTGTFVQYPRTYSGQLSTANTNYTTPATPLLLWVAGPDGSQIWGVSITPTATITTANQIQLYTSPDGGTTFNIAPISGAQATYTLAQTTALPTQLLTFPGGVAISPTNPFPLTGITSYEVLTYAQSTLSEPTTTFYGGKTGGTANAQTSLYCYNEAGTILPASPTAGTIIEFEAGVTNSAATTVAFGAQTAVSIKRASGTALSAGDLTVGFRYRAWWDGTQWILLITQRLYAAMGQAQANAFTAWGGDL